MRDSELWFKKYLLVLLCVFLAFPFLNAKVLCKDSTIIDSSWYEIENQPQESLIQLELWINTKTFKVNGKEKISDVSPIIKDGRTLVPVRIISEGLGAEVNWNPKEKKVHIRQECLEGEQNITLTINANSFYVNDVQKQLDVSPIIVNGRTMVPIRVISESLACKVYWNGSEKKVTVKGLNLYSDADNDGIKLKDEYIFGLNPNQKDDLTAYKHFGSPNSDVAFEEGTLYMADVDNDLIIDEEDYNKVKLAKGSTPKDRGWNYRLDIDRNKIIDGKDLLAVYVNLGTKYRFSDLLDRLDGKELKDSFIKFILSKIIACQKDIESNSVADYLNLLVSNKLKKEKVEYLINTGLSWEDGIQVDLEKQLILQYLDGNIGKNLIYQLQSYYLDEMEKRIPGLKHEIANLPEFDISIESTEAIEDIYGQVMRSKPYEQFEDRFDSQKITREKETWEAFSLMIENGHIRDERKLIKNEIFSSAKKIGVDGYDNDWNENIIYSTVINDFQQDTKSQETDLKSISLIADEENLYVMFKTVEKPSKRNNIQYLVHFDTNLDGMNEYSLTFHPGENQAYLDSGKKFFPVDSAMGNVIEFRIPLERFEIDVISRLGIMSAGIYDTENGEFSDIVHINILLEQIYQDFSYELPSHNVQLQGLMQLCLDNELCSNDTTALAISIADGLYRAIGDEEVLRQVRLDDNSMLTFSRELQQFLKQQNVSWNLYDYGISEKIVWAWRGNHTVSLGTFRLINRYSDRECSLDNFIDRTREKLTLFEYQWNNVKIETLRGMQKEMLAKTWLSSNPSSTINILRRKMHNGYNTDKIFTPENTCERKEMYLGKLYVPTGMDSANYEWYRYKQRGMGIGNCQDNTVFTEALLQSVGIPALSFLRRVVTPVGDSTGQIHYDHDGHAFPMFYNQDTKRWGFDSVDLYGPSGFVMLKKDAYYAAFVFMPPVKLQGYFERTDPTTSGIPPTVTISFSSDNNAWKKFYDIGYTGFRRLLLGGFSNVDFKKILEGYNFELNY